MRKWYYIIIGLLPRNLSRIIESFKWAYKLVVGRDSYLVKIGYIGSLLGEECTDEKGQIIPWMNYHFIDFLKERLSRHHSVFEYGSGFSTLFFAKRTEEITSVECNKEWFDKVCKMTQNEKNIEVVFANDDSEYSRIIKNDNKDKKYDVVIVDDIRRVECMKSALDCLSDVGVLILDDSNRPRYQEGIRFHIENGFSAMRFFGLKPGQFEASETTLMYKLHSNCFAL